MKSPGEKGTEPPFCGAFYDHKQDAPLLVCCDLPLFSSDHKFISGTVGPVSPPIDTEHITTNPT